MNAAYVDLHVHTAYSDGSDAPEAVVRRAQGLGLAAIAVTDHDTVDGVEEAERAADTAGLGFLRGVEITASFGHREVHVVGLGIDPRHPALRQALQELQQARSARIDAILSRLNRLGVQITRAGVEAQTSGTTLGRLHVARAIHASGQTRTVQEAFDRFIKAGKKAYVPNRMVPCAEAVALVHEAGGVAILAHPGVGSSVIRLLPRLLELPFDGIEVYHTRHTLAHVTLFTQYTLERSLLISGGSDCHGGALGHAPDMGNVRLPYCHFAAIADAIRRRRA